MKKVPTLTTEQLREAFSSHCEGWCERCGKSDLVSFDFHDHEFDVWLVNERHRVADLAIAKERKRAVKIVMANIGKVVWQAKHNDEAIDMTEMYEELMKED